MTSRAVTIRVAGVEDADLLADLGERTFRDTFGPDNTVADMIAYLAGAFGPGIQALEIADPATTFLIAESEGSAVAYARMKAGVAPAGVAGGRAVEIVRFYADAPWIGRGVGAALMTACLAEAGRQGCDAVWLDVWERNPRAIAFYEKWGFTTCGGRAFVLGGDVQHDLIMAREVSGDAAPDKPGGPTG